jgi:twitching motility protein PilJ
MLQKVKSLKISHKLILLTVVMAVPTILMVWYMDARNALIASTRNEQRGVEYLRVVRSLFEHVPQHNGVSAALIGGDQSLRGTQLNLENMVQSDLTSLDTVDQKYGADYGTKDKVASIQRGWSEIKQRVSRFTAKENTDAHAALVADIIDLMRTVGDKSELILDPEMHAYYMMSTMLIEVPQTAEQLSQIRGAGLAVASAGSATDAQRAQLNAMAARVPAMNANIRRSMQIALAGNSARDQKLSSIMNGALAASDALIQYTDEELVKPKSIRTNAKQYYDSSTAAIGEYLKLFDSNADQLYETLEARVSSYRKEQFTNAGIALFFLLLAGGLAVFIIRGLNRQIGAMANLFSSLGIGDFSARAEVYSEDELGQAALSLNTMLDSVLNLIQSREERDSIQDGIQKLLEEIGGLAEGDLTSEAEVTTAITGAIADAFNNVTEQLRGVIGKVQDTTLAVSSSAIEVQTTAEHLATGSESQALQIVEASAAIDEMTVSIHQVSGNASSAAGVADLALKNAKQGAEAVLKTIDGMNGIRQQVQQTAKRIKRLGESSQEIGEIVQLINDIAERTTILALNASIQAAMAGDAGKGFAVVAAEVERLAEHSTEATKKISGLIKSIQTDTNEAVSAMEETTREVVAESVLANEAGSRLSEIEKVSTQLAEIIQSISLASKQQSRGSEGVAKSMSEISQVTQQTAAGAKQAAVSIRRLAELADDLRGSLGRFKLPKKAA